MSFALALWVIVIAVFAEFAMLDATALAALVRDKQESPLELVDASIARIEHDRCGASPITYFREAFRVVLLLLMRHVDPSIVLTTLPGRNAHEVEYLLTLPRS
jgi:hypothetical protein